MLMANALGPQLLEFLQADGTLPLYRLIAEDRLKPGVRFTHQGRFCGKGFGRSNRTAHVHLSADVAEILPGRRLLIEFSKSGIVTDTAYTRLSGSTNLFTFSSVIEVDNNFIRAVPYAIGDLVDSGSGLGLRFVDGLRLPISDIDNFSATDFLWAPSPAEFRRLKNVSEKTVKSLICRLLGETDVPKDWGGEEADIFSSNLIVAGKRLVAAFLLKGPAQFHEMTMADCGKNGDQIYRLFNTPADVFVIQHCHKISPAVRKTVEAYALSHYSRRCRYTLIDGYDTARILHSHGLL
jgi:hypothetical protein